MRITELLQDATIDLGVKVNSKEEAIDHLVSEEESQFLILRTKQ